MHMIRDSFSVRAAFSLVELSIVLVILGLLTGGILAGQSLIRASEIRAVTTEYQKYAAATNSFRDKYFAWPGDMTNATKFWGAADGSTGLTNACQTAIGTGTATCNGNGDGQLSNLAYSTENARYWQHLANAGLIEGTYTGVSTGLPTWTTSGTSANIPRSRLSGGSWLLREYTGPAAYQDGSLLTAVYNNWMQMGREDSTWDNANSILKPEEMWNIDTKMDDGKPGLGKVLMRGWSTCTNATVNTQNTADYLLTSSTVGCVLIVPRFLG